MSNTLIFTLTFAAALGSGVVAGIFYGFSSFIMGALGRLPAPQGIAAMHSINVVVINAKFFAAFFGTAALCVVLGIYALLNWTADGAGLLLAGAVLYLAGCIGVTMGGNVPLNNALARLAPESAEGATLWARYLVVWTGWNTVRTAASLAAAGCFTAAMV